MATFAFSLGPWDDHGNARDLCLVGREVGGNATIVELHHDFESDTHLYGYWENDIFGKVFVQEVGDASLWEVEVPLLGFEGVRSGLAVTHSQRAACVAKIVDALSQSPTFDVRLAVPGKVLRQVVVRSTRDG